MSATKAKAIDRIKGILSQGMTPANIRLLLVDTRILLESSGKAKQYKTLKFYCDWVLHSQMSGKIASQLLAEVDEVMYKWRHQSIPMSKTFEDALAYQIGFYGFEEELERFLRTCGIDTARPGMVVNWRLFEALYCESLVKDCLLKYAGKKPLKLIHTGKAELFNVHEWPKPNNVKPGDCFPYGIKWTFEGDGDEVFVFTVDFPSPTVAPTLKSDKSQLIVRRPKLQPTPTTRVVSPCRRGACDL
jgi:hypothetical protein